MSRNQHSSTVSRSPPSNTLTKTNPELPSHQPPSDNIITAPKHEENEV
jgi:hypothetical protein